MKFNKLYLDYTNWNNFTILAFKEKFISKLDGDEENDDDLYREFIKKRADNKSDILRLVAIFDKIECIEATFDLTNLINIGLLEDDNSVLDNFKLLHPNNTIPEASDKKELLQIINLQTAEILIRSKRQIVNHFKNINHDGVLKDYYGKNLYYSFNEAIKYYTNFKNYQIDNAEEWFEDQLDWLYRSIFFGLYKSSQGELIYSPSYILKSSPQSLNPNKLLDEVYYTVKTKLTDEIIYLPQPKTLKEAIDIRNRREIVRFREVLGLWIDSIQKGDVQLEEQIRKDIKKANRELRRLTCIKEFTNSPINFWLNAIGGHIPFFSNILTATNMFAGLYEKHASRQSNWIMLTKNK